ncbi:MFS transporter [Actinomadura sp. 3N508]|uniref:MFS transporter n=1 Tax=Actinomadura sp. 3N508 TaxID=3375153 RepID=UPI0037B9BF5E
MPDTISAAAADGTARAGRKEWAGLLILALPTMLLSLDGSVLYLALPHISVDLGASATEQLWITDVYGFLLAGLLITMGTLGDRIGRRRLLLSGAALFGLVSVPAAMADSPEALVAARALLGVAGATLMPSTLALIGNMFTDPKERATAIGLWAGALMAGGALGPVIGGFLLGAFWWGSVFLMGVPVMALLLILGPVLLPEFRDPDAGRLEPVSVVLSLAAILAAIYGLKELALHGMDPPAVAAIVAGLGLAVAFVLRQRRVPDPLLDLRLFGRRAFGATLLIMLAGATVLSGTFLLVSQFVQLVGERPPAKAGLWLVPVGVSIALGAMVSPAIAQKVRPGVVMAGGLSLSVAGFVVLAQVGAGSGLAVLVLGIVIVYFGAGPSMALGTDLVVGSVPPEKTGSASSLSETCNQLGVALGIALLGSVGTGVYRARVDVPGADAERAKESLAGASDVAAHLPEGAAAALLDDAREAFTTGLNVAAGLGALLFLGLAALAVVGLRDVPPTGGQEPEAEAGTEPAPSGAAT